MIYSGGNGFSTCEISRGTYPVNDPCGMDVLQSAKNLIHEELHMIVAEFLRPYNVVQVSPHQVSNQISGKRNDRWLVRRRAYTYPGGTFRRDTYTC